MRTEILTITPAIAKNYLLLNTRNRPQNQKHVAQLARAMRLGEWKLNGEAIKLNHSVLIDGQHRLSACIQSNTPFESLVITGLDQEVFDTIDTGSSRNAANILAINGESHTSMLAATLRMVGTYLRGDNHRQHFSHQEIQSLLDDHPGTRKYVNWYANGSVKFLIGSVACSARYLCSLKDENDADYFFTSLVTGAGLGNGSPILALRNRFIDDMSSAKKIPPMIKFVMTLKAWNLYRKGAKVSYVKISTIGKNTDLPKIN